MRPALLLALLLCSSSVRADESIEPEADFRHFKDYAWFALGAASGFVGHELGHVVTDFMTGHHPTFRKTNYGGIPFFAIQPCCGQLSHAAQYEIASAGFAVGDISSELILQLAPRLRSRRAGFLKGVLVFDSALALGYAITGFLDARWPGLAPAQSDITSMARAYNVPAWQVGIVLAVPAIVDLYRYFAPRSVWAPWVSLSAKTMMVGMVLPLF